MDNLDYGIIGNCRSAALISKTGSVDWCCLPEFDSSSVFARILDERKGGSFDILVGEEYSSAGGIDIQAIRIDVLGTLMATSEIRIGNSSLRLDKTVSNRQFRLHPNGKRIIAGPLKVEKPT